MNLEHFRESLKLCDHKETRLWIGKTLTQVGKFQEAKLLLEELSESEPRAYQALAWVYERQEEWDLAIKALEKFLSHYPNSESAKSSLVRLRASELSPQEIEEELQALEDLGEEVSLSLVPKYVEKLLQSGKKSKARELIAHQGAALASKEGVQIAWIAYRNQIYDIAFDLFLLNLERTITDVKVLNSLEKAAKETQRVSELLQKYETLCAKDPRFYQRSRKLRAAETSRPK